MKGIRPYGGIANVVRGDEPATLWSVMYLGAGVGATFGAWSVDSWFGYQMVLRFNPTFAAASLVLYSPDISFAIGEEIESQSPGAGGQMSNALHYAGGGMMSGGSMPVVPYSGTGPFRLTSPSWTFESWWNSLQDGLQVEKPCERCKIVTITDEDSRLCYDCWVDLDIIDTELKDEQFISLCIHRVYMAKLYWRVKRDGKWTWTPAIDEQVRCGECGAPYIRPQLPLGEDK